MKQGLNTIAAPDRMHLRTFIMLSIGLMVVTAVCGQAQTLHGAVGTISIATAVPGSEPTPVVNTNSQVWYSGTAVISKITVRTVCANQKFDLSVVAGSITSGRGVAAPAVTLLNGMLAADFITSIPVGVAQTKVTLQYTLAPQFSDGTGTDTHTVTYTQVAQ